MKNIPVIIVGAGPVGMSLALALARQNVHSIILEQNSSTTQHPRARGVNVRSMELFNQWGNSSELLKYEHPKEAWRIIWSESFQGPEIIRIDANTDEASTVSPVGRSLVSQDRVEESLYHTLLNYKESQVKFLTEFLSFEENSKGVIVKFLDKKTQQVECLHTQYLIAADGAHSQIRKQLEITMNGADNLGKFCNVYCEIDITKWTKHRPCAGYFFTDQSLSGRWLASIDGDKRWVIGMRFSENMTRETFTDEYCINEIRRIVGISDLEIKIINKSFWTMAAQIASTYNKRNVFLVGDAAHILPPTGGFGMNTGIQDAHNLAWKLAFVINHRVPDKLLDTYYVERSKIAQQNINWSVENAKSYNDLYTAIHSNDIDLIKIKLLEQQRNLNSLGLDLGFIYHSNIICSENDQNLSVTATKYLPTTLPGSRAPHINLRINNKLISTLDLFEKDFVLLIGSDGVKWQKAAEDLSRNLSFPLKIYKIESENNLTSTNNIGFDAYEITNSGAVLVRPDGHVVWRSKILVEDPKSELEKYFDLIF